MAALVATSGFPMLVAAPEALAATTVVSLTFDDGYPFHPWVSGQLLARGWHGSFYLPSGMVDAGDGSAMTWPEAKALSDAGQDVGGHTRDHIDLTSTSYSYDYKYNETCGDRDEAIRNGVDSVTFAYPMGNTNSTAQSIVQACGYAAARTTAGLIYNKAPYAEPIPPVNAYAIKALGELSDPHKRIAHPSAADLETPVTNAINSGGGWLPMVFHGVCVPELPSYSACMGLSQSVTSSEFLAFLDWLKTQPVSVKSIGEVISPGGVLPSRVSVDSAVKYRNGLELRGAAGQRPTDGTTVTLTEYAGSYATGTSVLTTSTTSSLGQWSAIVPTPAQGTYTFVARQTNSYGGAGYSNQQHVVVDPAVPPADRAPVAGDDVFAAAATGTTNVAAPGVLGNDTDGDGDTLTAVKVTDPAHGTLNLAANGGFSYIPTAGYLGIDSFTYRANDGSLDSNVATVTVNVSGHAPVAANDAYATPPGVTRTVATPGVLTNDTDADGNMLTAVKISDPAHGTLALAANGGFTYTPATGFIGTDSFTYKASDGSLDSSVATVTLDVSGHAPVVADDAYTTPPGVAKTVAAPGVLGNDTDADGDPLTVVMVSGPVHGVLALGAHGGFTYTPASRFVGTDSFTYKATDGQLDSNPATVTMTVKVPTAISLTASAASLTYNQAVTLRTTLRHGTATMKSRTVSLQRCALVRTGPTQACGAWKTIKTLQTNAYGVAAYTGHPSWNARYRWVFTATARFAASTSRVAAIYVRPAMSAAAGATTTAHNHRVTLTARVRPNHAGQRVILQRYVRGVGWVKASTVALTTVDATTSKAATRVLLSKVGSYRFRFVMPADRTHVTGVSNTVAIRAT